MSAKFGDPQFGEELIYADGDRAGQHMKDSTLTIGVKIKNAIDGIEQAVRGNGKGIIIIGGAVTPKNAALLDQNLRQLTHGTGDPELLDLKSIKELLSYANTELKLDDVWTGSLQDVLKADPVYKHPIIENRGLKQYTGYFAHTPKAGNGLTAFYINGGCIFQGDVAGGRQDYTNTRGFYVTFGIRNGISQFRGLALGSF